MDSHLDYIKIFEICGFLAYPFERSILKDLPDFHLICPGSFGNFLSSEFMLPAVAPAFMPDDHQDDSSDMTLDPVLQSVI
ncbi:unnamed protein product [Rhizophagus irregularis]|uniref:Uncharacterized protein n=1 Tax=Rhizophagus irregularis TaxID=588596 RepID=A0A915ZF88_9GLOM|nr:unnamed protein product [Rhizophagus irregularis]